MPKFLIYNKTHWMDLPSKSEPLKTGYKRNEAIIDSKIIAVSDKMGEFARLESKYNAKSITGDIAEIRNDDAHLCGKEFASYVLIQVDMDEKEEEQYKDNVHFGDALKHNLRFNLDISGINFNEKTKEASIQLSPTPLEQVMRSQF